MRHLATISDLSDEDILEILNLASDYVESHGSPGRPRAIRGGVDKLARRVLATLFFEPSTRTRLSFESAMIRLGGGVITAADASQTSATKGETLADTVRIVSSYADAIVLRHGNDGAARLASEYARVPVINAGDGRHEHPTQTLCDLFTIWRERCRPAGATTVEKAHFRGRHVAVWGDLLNGRTVHSLVQALLRFGVSVGTYAAEGFGLPESMRRRLVEEHDVEVVHRPGVDAIYVPADSSAEDRRSAGEAADAIYVTRLQKERVDEGSTPAAYASVSKAMLENAPFNGTLIMHPLPRVAELPYDLDDLDQAGYFQQAAYGVPVRMALLEVLLDRWLGTDAAKNERTVTISPADGVSCPNPRCISVAESRATPARFDVSTSRGRERVRCHYCEDDVPGGPPSANV